jgi:CheY-like chemotaxis protein
MNSSIATRTRQDAGTVRQAPAAPAPVGPPVALLIAGDPGQADLYALKLRADGYVVRPASGLERGLELAGAEEPDLVFVCLGAWAVPALVLLVLRSDPATRTVPTILVTEQSREELAAEVGGLLPTEHVVPSRPGAPRPAPQQRHGPMSRWAV